MLKLGPPSAGEVTIKVDPGETGGACVVGTQNLEPGAAIPTHRHGRHDEVLFVHKGQGRATLDGRLMTVVPGFMLYVPRDHWHSLRNTGTGLLQVIWMATPPGIEDFFRECARRSDLVDPATYQELARRFDVEVEIGGGHAPALEAPVRKAQGRRRRRRGGRARHPHEPSMSRHGTAAQPPREAPSTRPAAMPKIAPSESMSDAPRPELPDDVELLPTVSGERPAAVAPTEREPHALQAHAGVEAQARPGHAASHGRDVGRPRRRRHRRGHGRGRGASGSGMIVASPHAAASAPTTAPSTAPVPAPKPPQAASATPSHEQKDRRHRPPHRRGRVKEVYMGGRWVQVTGDGPVVDTG